MAQANRRALQPQDKQARREHILETAALVFNECTFAEVTMASVAASAGLAKGTLYLYYASKEALFAQLYLQEYGGWLRAVSRELAILEQPVSARRGAQAIADAFRPRRNLARLLRLAHPVLLADLSADETAEVEAQLDTLWLEAAVALEAHLAGLGPGDGLPFIRQLHAVAVGLVQGESAAPHVEASPSLASEMTAMLTALLRGKSFLEGKPRARAAQQG